MRRLSMRRITILAVLSAVLLLGLTGCDRILELFYPEFTDVFAEIGERGIIVDIEVDTSLSDREEFGDVAVRIAIVPYVEDEATGLLEMDEENIYNEEFWGQRFIHYTFTPLPENLYRVFVWYDENDDWLPDFEEPSVLAGYDPDPTDEEDRWVNLYDLNGEARMLDAIMYLSDRPDIPFDFLAQIHGEGPDFVDYSFHVEGPPIIDPDALQSFEYRVVPHNAQEISTVSWQLVDWSTDSAVTVSGETVHTVTGGSVGFVVNYGSMDPAPAADEWYDLFVTVTYADDTTFDSWYEIVSANEEAAGTSYELWVDIAAQ
jgi:hypothetical protein